MTQYDLYSNPKPVFVKSPFNYIGGKYKLLGELVPLFPSYIGVFVDVFGGGFNVGVNVDCGGVVYNDSITPLVELMRYLYTNKISSTLNYIENTIRENGLSITDKDSFNRFRLQYNQSNPRNPLDLYVLICFSFNHQLRFNNQLEYNSSHGTNRSQYNHRMKQNIVRFMEQLHKRNVCFTNNDFRDFNYLEYDNRVSFFYFDPPYYITSSPYHDGKRGFGDWTIREENDLYNLLDDLTMTGYKWGLSNTLVHDGKRNNVLEEWLDSNNYNVITVNSDYSNSNYQKNNKNNEDNIEVYVGNYPIK